MNNARGLSLTLELVESTAAGVTANLANPESREATLEVLDTMFQSPEWREHTRPHEQEALLHTCYVFMSMLQATPNNPERLLETFLTSLKGITLYLAAARHHLPE